MRTEGKGVLWRTRMGGFWGGSFYVWDRVLGFAFVGGELYFVGFVRTLMLGGELEISGAIS